MVKHVYFSLPYGLRRSIYACCKYKSFKKFQQQKNIETQSGYSLKPFKDNKCIFVHIPKAAGISVCKALFSNLAGGHRTVANYQIVFPKKEFDDFFKFTIVRNPWSRLYSAYTFLKKGGINSEDKKWAEQNLSEFGDFNEFVKKWVNSFNINKYIHFIPQYRFLCLPNSEDLQVDFIGYFETLETDFTHISESVFGKKLRLTHENNTFVRSEKESYISFYNEESIQIVAQVYKKDIELLGYSFDNSSLEHQLQNRDGNPFF
jgi:hypothetical protein